MVCWAKGADLLRVERRLKSPPTRSITVSDSINGKDDSSSTSLLTASKERLCVSVVIVKV
jgi:hypothetical protein